MIFDLSHPLNNETPVFPGTQSPVFEQTATIEKKGYRETYLRFQSHLGTHIDAPAHMLKNGSTLDQMDISSFHGKALIIEIKHGIHEIDKSFPEQFSDELKVVEFVLFRTGWNQFWGKQKYFEGFPVLTLEALEYLFTFPLKGIGFDTISADPVESTDYRNHYAIFEKGLIIIENLNFPESLKENKGAFSCYPLPYEKADGSPVRAVLKV